MVLFSLSLISCNSYSEYIFKDNYQVRLLNNNHSIIYLVENEAKLDSTVICYKKENLKLNLSKIQFNSSTKSNRHVSIRKKIKTIQFGKDSSNNVHFKVFEDARFAIVNNSLSTIDSIWLKSNVR
ncbi:Lipoprotein [Chryseobacterium flavum]